MFELDKIKKDLDWLLKQYTCLTNRANTAPLAATRWTANHTVALGNPYQPNTLVWYQGNVYISKVQNSSVIPTNTSYWTDLGPGNILEQELSTGGSNVQTNWTETNVSSPAYLLNKPSTFPPSSHTHAMSDVIGLNLALLNKVDVVAGKGLSTEDYTTPEKLKLAGIQAGATANSSDATLLNRANHTGTQAISTVTGLQTTLDNKVNVVAGKQLSTEDYTTPEKLKLAGIQAGAQVNNISDVNALALTSSGDTSLHHHDGRYYTETEVNILLENNAFDTLITNTLAYLLPVYNTTSFGATLRTGTISLSGNGNNSDRIANITFSTTTTAGTLAFQRGTPIIINFFPTFKTCYKTKFKMNSAIADTRFFNGLSAMYALTAPTNVAVDTLINSIGVGKLSTSNNFHVIHNDASGLATAIDLGVNFPADNTIDYWYILEIRKESNSTDLTVILTRIDATGGTLTSTTIVSTNSPGTVSMYPVSWICNNTTAAAASYKHYGIIFTQRDLF